MTFQTNIQEIVDSKEGQEKADLIQALNEYMEVFNFAPDPDLIDRLTDEAPQPSMRHRVFGPYLSNY